MSRDGLDRKPLIALVHDADRAFQSHMVRTARDQGRWDAKPAHNHVFGTLSSAGDRSADLAARAGITRQAMGEIVRDLVDLGVVEMAPDPTDRRAKIVRYTEAGLVLARGGRRHLADLERRFAADLGDAEYEVLRTSLARVTAILAELDADQAAPPR